MMITDERLGGLKDPSNTTDEAGTGRHTEILVARRIWSRKCNESNWVVDQNCSQGFVDYQGVAACKLEMFRNVKKWKRRLGEFDDVKKLPPSAAAHLPTKLL